MPRKKLIRFAEVENFENVFLKDCGMKGKWGSFFADAGAITPCANVDSGVSEGEKNLVLELACGAGNYTLKLAQRHSDSNYVGVDRKKDRVWIGAKKALELNIPNVAFLCANIENLDDYFDENEVDEIWITFPDPYEKPSKSGHRLTSPKFLKIYKKLLKSGANLHLKTDNLRLFDFSVKSLTDNGFGIVQEIRDLYKADAQEELKSIKTYYEEKFLKEGRKIYYLRANLQG